MAFKPATKKQMKLRLALIGPGGSGKTFTALRIASALGPKIALICSERGTAQKYAGDVATFDISIPTVFSVEMYIEEIRAASEAGCDTLIIDGLSAAWSGRGGLLEFNDEVAKRRGGNTFDAWRETTPKYHRLIDAIASAPMHIIATMRTKNDTVVEKNERGKNTPRKIGLKADMREGFEYEFDVVGELDVEHEMTVTKSRCSAVERAIIEKPGEAFGRTLLAWLDDGETLPPAASDEQRQAVKDALLALRLDAKNGQALVQQIVGHDRKLTRDEASAVLAELERRRAAKAAEAARAAAKPAPMRSSVAPAAADQVRKTTAAPGEPPKKELTLVQLRALIGRALDELGIADDDVRQGTIWEVVGHNNPPSHADLRRALAVLQERAQATTRRAEMERAVVHQYTELAGARSIETVEWLLEQWNEVLATAAWGLTPELETQLLAHENAMRAYVLDVPGGIAEADLVEVRRLEAFVEEARSRGVLTDVPHDQA